MMSKDTMYAMIRNFVLYPRDDAYRVHLSHTDMDGYGCQLVTKFFQHAAAVRFKPGYTRKIPRKHEIVYDNMTYEPESQKETIDRVIKHLQLNTRFFRETDTIHFLVTDISNFNPDVVFAPYRRQGYQIEYLVVDHHPDRNGIGEEAQAFQLLGSGKLGFSANGWFSFTDASATKHLMDAFDPERFAPTELSKRMSYMDDYTEMHTQFVNDILRLQAICSLISRSDTGNWDTWLVNNFKDVGGATLTRLAYTHYDRIPEGGRIWLADYLRSFGVTLDHTLDGLDPKFRVKQHSWMLEEFARTEWNLLLDEYHRFVSNVTIAPTFCGSVDLDREDKGWKIEYVDCTKFDTGADRYPNFSICAKKYLERSSTDILVGYCGSGYYSLRSGDDGPDVGQIAVLFDGGGHAHAAGFMYPEGILRE